MYYAKITPQSNDILLVNPPDIFTSHFPFGLAQIAASLIKTGFKVKIIDLVYKRSSDAMLQNEIINQLRQTKVKIIGLTGMVHNYLWLRELTFKVKSIFKEICIVAGGHWSYHEPDFILANTAVDVVVNGEGDYVVRDVCSAILEEKSLCNIKGITYKEDGKIISNGPPDVINDLNQLPIPPYDYFNMENYVKREIWAAEISHKKEALCISMQTGRGCIGKCMFCTGAKQMFRKYSPLYVINHIKYIKDRYAIKVIRFKEALTLGNKQWVQEFCTLLISQKINILYECISRVDTIDEDIAKLLKESGCCRIQFGIESADDYILSEIAKKKITAGDTQYAIYLCKKNNILPIGGFIIGLPGETVSSLNKTLCFIWNTKIEETSVTFPTPFPGTALFNMALERFNISKEQIFNDSSIMAYNEELQDRIIKKYNFTHIRPATLRLYRFLFNETFFLNRLYRKKRYFRFFFELILFAHLRLLKKIFEGEF